MTATPTVREGRNLRKIGWIGLGVLLALNVAKCFLLGDQDAVPFSGGWWSHWFAGYVVLGIVLILGNAGRRYVPVESEVRSEGSGVRSEANAAWPDERWNPEAKPIAFDRVFKVYAEKRGKVSRAEILQAISEMVRSGGEALVLMERCKDLETDAVHFVQIKVLGQINLARVREELLVKHPYLSEEALERAIDLGAVLVVRG